MSIAWEQRCIFSKGEWHPSGDAAGPAGRTGEGPVQQRNITRGVPSWNLDSSWLNLEFWPAAVVQSPRLKKKKKT